ncbi:hypothetical protein C0995_000211 [Termitomyces sp. Mi166|nr:hypothetical protein C0995_000211 [Termitomyces sp. Mi166\
MALSVSGFPEPMRQLDTDDSSLGALQRSLSLFSRKRQNTDDIVPDSAPPEPSPISTTAEFAQMAILQPPPMNIPSPSLPRPRQVSLTRRTPPPPQRQPSIGRLEIGSVSNRPSLPKPPPSVQETQPPPMAHPRPLPAVPALVPQGLIIESSKSTALRAAAAPSAVQPLPRPLASRNAVAGPSRPRTATAGPHHTHQPLTVDPTETPGPRTATAGPHQPLTLDPTETPGASSSSSTSTPVHTPALSPTPTPQNTSSTTANLPTASGPRPLPRIPPASAAPIVSSAPIPAAPLSAAMVTSHIQSSYVPPSPRVKRPKTSPSSSTGFGSAVRSPFDAVPSSWVSRPVDLNPSGPSASGSTSNAYASSSGSSSYASGSGSNAHASGSGSSAHSGSGSGSASGPSSRPRSLPRPRSHSRTRDQSAEASRSGSRSRGAASPIRRAPLATGSTSAPLPSSPGFASASASGSGSGAFTTPPNSRRASASSNPPTPRSSIAPGAIGSPRASPRIPSLPPPKVIRALPLPGKIIEESTITSVRAMTFTTSAPNSPSASTFLASPSIHASIPPSPLAHTSVPASPPAHHSTARSQSVSHPTSILKNSKNRGPTRTRTLQLHGPPPEIPRSPSHKSPPSETMNTDACADASVDVDGSTIITGDARSFVSRSPSPMRYAPHEDFLSDDDDAHPDNRSRPRNRSQLRSYRHSYRPKQPERSPSPIAYAKRSLVDIGNPDVDGGVVVVDDEEDNDLDGRQKQKRHTQPRSYRCIKPPEEVEEKQKKESIWKELLGTSRKDSKDSQAEKADREGGHAWDTVWINNLSSGLVRKRSRSKIMASQTPSRDSVSGSKTGTSTSRSSVIDISSPPATSSIVPNRNRAFTTNYSNPNLSSEDCTVNSHDSTSKASTSTGSNHGSQKQPKRPSAPLYTPPVDSATFNFNINMNVPARTGMISDVSQQRPGHTRVKSDSILGGGGHGQGQTHRAPLSGVVWGAEVHADANHAQWDKTTRLVPLRKDMGSVFDSEEEEEEEEEERGQGLDMDMVRLIPVLRLLKAKS